MSATSLDQAMLEVLQMVATEDEINTLVILLDGMSHRRIESWYIDFICEIIRRLAELVSTVEPHNRTGSTTGNPPR